MFEDETLAGNSGTATTTEAQDTVENTPETGNPTPEITFTQSQVNNLMRKRVERSHNSFFNRYGVKNLEELDDLVSKSMSWDEAEAKNNEWSQKYNDLETSHKDLTKKYAYKVGNIDEKKIADIETYFKGKGIDIDENTLMEELKTHPEWVAKVATIKQLGAETATPPENDGRAEAEKIFGVRLNRRSY